MSSEKNAQWWEFYAVRYAQGTVVGAVIIFFLFSQNPILERLLLLPEENRDFGMAHLILLAVYGLAYCYIASAPVLVMHAWRGMLFKSTVNSEPIKRSLWRVMELLIFFVIIYLIVALFIMEGMLSILIVPVIPFMITVSLQLFCLWKLLLFENVVFLLKKIPILKKIEDMSPGYYWERTVNYYVSVARKRKELEESSYIESYKHIREHGNAFLIVFFQIVLGLAIFSVTTFEGVASVPIQPQSLEISPLLQKKCERPVERNLENRKHYCQIFISNNLQKSMHERFVVRNNNSDAASNVVRKLVLLLLFWVIPPSLIWFFGNKLENHIQSLLRGDVLPFSNRRL